MVILGFMLNYALRTCLTIALVEMVLPKSEESNVTMSDNSTIVTTMATTLTESTRISTIFGESRRFNWDSHQVQLVLGSFYWGYILTELPGGRLAELVGGHRVFGHSMLWASVITLLTPAAANFSYTAFIVLRVLLGFMLGASWPAIHPMTAVWIRPMERSKFMSNMMASSLGAAISMPICGYLINWFGWESAFYFCGAIGFIWSICWFVFIFETPAVHPRISEEERKDIEDAIGSTTSKKRPTYVPWGSILSSPAVWAIILTHGASVYGYFTIANQLPNYMKHILQFDIKKNGLFSSFPYFGKYFMALAASFFADYLRQSGKMSTTVTRKVFTTFAVATPGCMMILQVFFGHSQTWSVLIFTIALTLNGAVTAGYLGNGLDIAPNFSGTIFGMANTLSSFGGYLSTWMVGVLTFENNTYAQWQIVFSILAATYILGSLAFLIMGSGNLQPWNTPPERNGNALQEQEEGVPLKQIGQKTN
ncbi:unnamed protein product [Diamesa hyperborea]